MRCRSRGAIKAIGIGLCADTDAVRCSEVWLDASIACWPLGAEILQSIVLPIGGSHRQRAGAVGGHNQAAANGLVMKVVVIAEQLQCSGLRARLFGNSDVIDPKSRDAVGNDFQRIVIAILDIL